MKKTTKKKAKIIKPVEEVEVTKPEANIRKTAKVGDSVLCVGGRADGKAVTVTGRKVSIPYESDVDGESITKSEDYIMKNGKYHLAK